MNTRQIFAQTGSFIVFFAVIFFPFDAKAKNHFICNNQPKIDFKFMYDTGDITLNHDLSSHELTQKMSQSSIFGNHGSNVKGLTSPVIETQFLIEAKIEQLPTTGFCIYLSNAYLELVYKDVMIYIAKEIKKDSCRYKIVYDHEMTHADIYQVSLEYYAPYISEALKRAANSTAPVYVFSQQDVNKIKQMLMKEIKQKTDSVINYMYKEQEKQNLRLDTSENYGYASELFNQCPN